MKKLFFAVLSVIALALFSCSRYDDSDLWEAVNENSQRLLKLEQLCESLNQDVLSLKALVESLSQNDFVTGVSSLLEEEGYAITFKSGKTVVIRNGKDGETPLIGVRKDTDGVYYWTLDGSWILGQDGEKIRTTGQTPSLKIQDDYWYVSIDSGASWKMLGKASGDDGDSFFKGVSENETTVILTLSDGSQITLPKLQKMDIVFEDSIDIGIEPGGERKLYYTITNSTSSTLVKTVSQNGWSAKVFPSDCKSGYILVKAPLSLTDDEILVFVYDGEYSTIMKALNFVKGSITVVEEKLEFEPIGGTIGVGITSNMGMEVSIPQGAEQWLSFSEAPVTKTMIHSELVFTATKNTDSSDRSALVRITDAEGGNEKTLCFTQRKYETYSESYSSTDYSSDGVVDTISSHTLGKGIKVLVVGDGFTDIDISNGYYDRCMENAAEYFFSVEPYSSFRNRFDVVSMKKVSSTGKFDSSENTAFQSLFGSGTYISGNNSEVYSCMKEVFGTKINVLAIVVLNSSKYAGTTYMNTSGYSVCYVPMASSFEELIHHEAGGHGFAFLGDEYYTSGTTISELEKTSLAWASSLYGWYENVDIRSSKDEVKWADFFKDSRYSSSVGVYEGGYTYEKGVYRPTSTSIMKNNKGEFNSPSRYSIYKRIMKLSGETSSWDSFVSYDAVSLGMKSSAVKNSSCVDENAFIPLAPPVIVDYLQ